MKYVQKQWAILLLALVCIVSMVSCQRPEESTPTDWLQVADESIKDASYTATIETSFSTTDGAMKDAVAALERSKTTLAVQGDAFSIDMQVKLGSTEMNRTYVMANGTLYHTNTLQVGEETVTVRQKATVSALDLYLTLEDVSAGATIGHDDFNTKTLTQNGEQYRVTCTDIHGDALIALNTIFSAPFEDATLLVNDAGYEAIIENGTYTKTLLHIDYTVLSNGESYEFTATRTTTYAYPDAVTVTAPANGADYTTVSYGDIVQ